MSLTDTDLSELIDPAHTAVLVIDKQYGYFKRESTVTTELLAKVEPMETFILTARTKNVPVYWTQMIENIDDAPENLGYVMRHDEQYAELTRQGEQSFEFYGDVTPREGEEIIVKKRYNAFAKTTLASDMRNKGITTIIFIGGYASRCVLASVIGAVDEGFKVVVSPQLVGNTDNTLHELPAAFNIISTIYGFVIDQQRMYTGWS